MTSSTRTPILHVVGARPNLPKLAPVLTALDAAGIEQKVVNTGQHYDDALFGTLIRDLQLRDPDVELGVGSGSHAWQTAKVLERLEPVVDSLAPSLVVVYGDVNSALGATLVAVKKGISVAHVEAGLRSGDRSMPEEINRVAIDHLADVLFATSQDAVDNLHAEGLSSRSVHLVGNPMIDSLFRVTSNLPEDYGREILPADVSAYAVATLHRPSNVDSAAGANRALRALETLSRRLHTIFPVHPRGIESLKQQGLLDLTNVTVTGPLPYTHFMGLVRGATLVLTDSGGVQEETTAFGVPCLTLRPNTERPVTISHGTNRLVEYSNVGAEVDRVISAPTGQGLPQIPPMWDGRAGERIGRLLAELV